VLPGRPLEVAGDGDPRGMIVLDRTRLTGRLLFSQPVPVRGYCGRMLLGCTSLRAIRTAT